MGYGKGRRMARTLAQQLDAVDAAIAKIEARTQAITHEGKTYTRANIKSLYDERRHLRSLIAQEAANASSSGGGRTITEF